MVFILFYLQLCRRNIPSRRMKQGQRTQIMYKTIAKEIVCFVAAQLLPEAPKPLTTLLGFIAE